MVGINIDIKTRALPADHRVYIVRPGANYRLYQDVAEQETILFDLPALDLPRGVPFLEIEDIVAQVQRGHAIKEWYRHGQLNDDAKPSSDLENYPNPDTASARRSVSQMLSIGRAFFERSRIGDMVIVPPLRFADPVLVGEIVSDDRVATRVQAYRRERVYGRKVRWLASIPKHDIPSRVIEISQKPNSFVQLERSTAIWFYDRTYKSYSLDGQYQCEFRITAEKFGSTDDAKLAAFLNFVAANLSRFEAGARPISINQAMFADLGDYEPDKRASINSPGELIIHAARITPLLFSVLLGLSGCAPDGVATAVADRTVVIGNSAGGPNDPCAAEVYQSTIDWLTFVGADLWLEACPIASQAAASAGVEIPSSVVVNQ